MPAAWPGPSANWSYHSNYAACNSALAPDDPRSMIDFYRALAPVLPGKIVVYNGDTDPCVSYEGGQHTNRMTTTQANQSHGQDTLSPAVNGGLTSKRPTPDPDPMRTILF